MREIEYRDALNEAFDEELARDENVVLMGEEVAQYNGAYKVTRGLIQSVTVFDFAHNISGKKLIVKEVASNLGSFGIVVGFPVNIVRNIFDGGSRGFFCKLGGSGGLLFGFSIDRLS